MTIIVYDNGALLTDSLGMAKFGETTRTSYHANKIHINESRTVAMAYCGETGSDSRNAWFFRHLEAQLVLLDLIDLQRVTGEPIVDKAMKTLSQIIELFPSAPEGMNSGIAISRQFAVEFDKDGYREITHNRYNGQGCAVDSYWLMRDAGLSSVQAMEKLNDISPLIGGNINMQMRTGLAFPDVKGYCMKFVDVKNHKDFKIKDLKLEALSMSNNKRKGG